ncbi:MAG: hypothetical protein J6I55_00500 [Ruminococcus sp.]|jgi:archaellum component FlaC|nr:hypothetical protein [Ruminococcus sp.]HAE52551.1 hypothetical protein [Ruminococcus sp.]
MSDYRLTNEKMKTYDGEAPTLFKTGAKLAEIGEKQNIANESLAANVNSLIKRVCALEEQHLQTVEIMKKIANELNSFKKELDRLRLSDKLNTNAVERLDRAVKMLQEINSENQ